ncbi:MAG: radical SAM protein [Dehalococcoidia bacterium]|nr:radical SAM protein [Dehalococcoidia bacterium]
MEEHAFHYGLQVNREYPSRDALLGMVRGQLRNILDIAVLMKDGREIDPDGFKLLLDRTSTYEIRSPGADGISASPDSTSIYEPRIDFARKQLESLLSVIELESRGQVIPVDGFKLKNLPDWLTFDAFDSSEILEYAATRCNCDCVFCYNKGAPSSLALRSAKKTAREELNEIKTRLSYLSPDAGIGLFPCPPLSYDFLAHPYFREILRSLREKTPQPLRISTNGRNLTPETIAELAALGSIYLYFSLNTSSPERRKNLMRDSEPQIAISAPGLLREKGIPYAAVIVPWPVNSIDEMCQDICQTVTYVDGCGAHLIEVNLPGYSSEFSREKLFDLDEVWQACISTIRKLREETGCPIVAMPCMYEENLYEERKNLPRIMGMVRNSPAARSGLRMGDVIVGINNVHIKSRPQARDMLYMLQGSNQRMTKFTIQRGKQKLDLAVNLEDFDYPYSREFDRHLGVIFMGTGLRLSYIERLREIIDESRARDVLFLSSSLVKPTFEQCLRESHLFSSGGFKLTVEVPRNNYFGGNIFMGDLLVVQDFIDHIKDYLKRQLAPDLVVIPSSPFSRGRWGRDLTGRVYLDIERETGIPVKLLECNTIYD